MEAGQTSRVCRHKSWAHTVFDEESKTQIFNSISLCRFRSFFYSSDVTRRRGNYRFMERIGHRIQGNSHCRRSCNGVRGSWLALADFSSLVSAFPRPQRHLARHDSKYRAGSKYSAHSPYSGYSDDQTVLRWTQLCHAYLRNVEPKFSRRLLARRR